MLSMFRASGVVATGILILGALYGAPASAFDPSLPSDAPERAFRQFINIEKLPIVVPTVVELPLPDILLEYTDFVVLEAPEFTYEPYLYLHKSTAVKTPLSIGVQAGGAFTRPWGLTDNDTYTSVDIPLPDTRAGRAEFYIDAQMPITASGFELTLAPYVTLPRTIEIRIADPGNQKIILAQTPLTANKVRFPASTGSSWVVTLTYDQPLRIAEMYLLEEGAELSEYSAVRFLAQPGRSYIVYLNPDRATVSTAREYTNLSSNEGVLKLKAGKIEQNTQYVMSDSDYDGIPDVHDNCRNVSNADQMDRDNNGSGDVCEDFDRDNVMNEKDNCPNDPNMRQEDEDGDGLGDVCDAEESRFTEKYPWIPWLGIAGAGLVLVILFWLTLRSTRKMETPPDSA